MSAPAFRHGLTLDQIFTGLEHGYQSVRARLTDSERIRQWEQSRQKMQQAYALFKAGKVLEGNARSRKQRSRSRRCGESKDGRFRGRSSVTPSTAAMSWTRTDGQSIWCPNLCRLTHGSLLQLSDCPRQVLPTSGPAKLDNLGQVDAILNKQAPA